MSSFNLRACFALLAGASLFGISACTTDNAFDVAATSAQQTGNLAAGPLSVTASSPSSRAFASVTIPQGTTLFDRNGQPLSNTNVTLIVDAYDGSRAAESVFEGGVTFTDQPVISQVSNALNKNIDASRPATLDLAGYAVITVLVNNVQVKQFGQPITVTIGTPGQTPGSRVAVITVDEVDGERTFEGSTTVRSNRTAIFTLDHLTAAATVGNVTGTLSGGSGGSGR